MARFKALREGSAEVRLRPWLMVAAMVLALGATPLARAAGLKDVSMDGFRADVMRLQGVVAECAAAAVGVLTMRG